MKGDFSRNTFDPSQHFLRVLMQQGRVQLDADWNEQGLIQCHYLQYLAKDLIGPHGGPADIIDEQSSNLVLKKNLAFELIVDQDRIDKFSELTDDEKLNLKKTLTDGHPPILLGKGRYYVDGVLCENEHYVLFEKQPDWPGERKLEEPSYLIYLDVWERHITYHDDDHIREVALGGPDTATRAKVVWQVKLTAEKPDGKSIPTLRPRSFERWREWVDSNWSNWLEKWQPRQRGWLRARSKGSPQPDTNPCITPPEARYRGEENQLYRVEIHTPGKAGTATFKWSRDNGTAVFPIRRVAGEVVTLEHLGRDHRFGLKAGDWVEIVDDDYALQERAEPLLQVVNIDPISMQVTLNSGAPADVGQNEMKHPLLRRWDHQVDDPGQGNGTIIIEEGTGWVTLEDGVEIQFQSPASGENYYRSGDYWQIPARTATGNVEWPQEYISNKLAPKALPPLGVNHSYAPLAIVSVDPNGVVTVPKDGGDLRRTFGPLAQPIL